VISLEDAVSKSSCYRNDPANLQTRQVPIAFGQLKAHNLCENVTTTHSVPGVNYITKIFEWMMKLGVFGNDAFPVAALNFFYLALSFTNK